jgi:hypothetical protein
MLLQGIIVGVLVLAAALYVFRTLAPPRWRRKLGLARRGAGGAAGSDAAANGGSCGCSSCPPARSKLPR